MTSHQTRRHRIAKPTLESLDDRIVPSAGGAGLRAQALEARAIHMAEVRAARAEQRAELRESRVLQLQARAEHRAEIQAARMQLRQAQLQHRAELRASRLHPGMAASTMTTSFTAPSTVAMTSATTSQSSPSVASDTSTSANPAPTNFPNMVIGAPMPASPSDPISTAPSTSSITSSQGAANNAAATGTPVDVSDIKNGPMAKAGQNLIAVYTQFESAGAPSDFTLTGSLANMIRIQGDSVGVDIGTAPSNVTSLSSTLTALGMQITATDPTTGMIEGFLPIAQLPTVSQNGDVLTLSPNYLPSMPPSTGTGGGFVPR